MNNAYIKVQDLNGNWIDAKIVEHLSDQYVYQQMVQVQQNFGGKRVKAVDKNGHLIDLLG